MVVGEVCHAFCRTLEKFALDPATRFSVLDSGCLTNFPVLCAISPRIFTRLAQSMYSVSCSAHYVQRLVSEHDCVKVVASLVEANAIQTKSLDGARDTCSALLFNFSTQDDVKTELVLKGATHLAFSLWKIVGEGARRNCSLVACNLAVGKVNTAKMVRHGAGQLLVDLVANTNAQKDQDVRKRASAAFRNLLCVSGNHVRLAEEGAISALVDLARTGCPAVRRNCASALRSMTCKAEVRELLIASGAIKVILDDAQNQDADENLSINTNLLCQIEAESWVNGTRGILVESRAPSLPRLEQNCSLLQRIIEDEAYSRPLADLLKSEDGREPLYGMPWEKLQALNITLQEPNMELSTKQSAASRFDDEGLAAALAGDADNERTGIEPTADAPTLPSARGMGYTKMEPKEKSEDATAALLEDGGEWDSLSTDGSTGRKRDKKDRRRSRGSSSGGSRGSLAKDSLSTSSQSALIGPNLHEHSNSSSTTGTLFSSDSRVLRRSSLGSTPEAGGGDDESQSTSGEESETGTATGTETDNGTGAKTDSLTETDAETDTATEARTRNSTAAGAATDSGTEKEGRMRHHRNSQTGRSTRRRERRHRPRRRRVRASDPSCAAENYGNIDQWRRTSDSDLESESSGVNVAKGRRRDSQRHERRHRRQQGQRKSNALIARGHLQARRGGSRGGLTIRESDARKQRSDVEPLPDPEMMDWEVAVVAAARNADDMVTKYKQTRREMIPVRRGSINIVSLGATRLNSILAPGAGSGATGASEATNVTGSVLSGLKAAGVRPSVSASRRSSVLMPGGSCAQRYGRSSLMFPNGQPAATTATAAAAAAAAAATAGGRRASVMLPPSSMEGKGATSVGQGRRNEDGPMGNMTVAGIVPTSRNAVIRRRCSSAIQAGRSSMMSPNRTVAGGDEGKKPPASLSLMPNGCHQFTERTIPGRVEALSSVRENAVG